jgi:sugar fermentation stimulation protein A
LPNASGDTTLLIPHHRPLLEGRLLARYDRFIVAVDLGSETIEAHCVNPGRMEGLVKAGARAWVSPAPPDSRRKLRYTLELLEIDGQIIGANTVTPNALAETLVRERLIPGLKRFRSLRREVRYGEKSRIDLMLEIGQRQHLVEVKNCHLVYPDGGAYFPDSVSDRAAGHLRELARECAAGNRATVLFMLQRTDARFLRPSRLHDPAFAAATEEAATAGVRFRAACVEPTLEGFVFRGMVPVDLKPYDPSKLAPFREVLLPDSGWRRRGRRAAAATTVAS